MMSARPIEPLPWHDAARIVGRRNSVEQAIKDADLGRFVVREPQPGRRELFSEGRVSSDPPIFLKVLRRKIIPLQNNDAFALFQPLIDLGCLAIDSVGEWKGGEWVWMVFEVLNCEFPSDQEPLRPFLLSGHDPLTNYFKLSYLFVRARTNGVLTEGTFHNPEPYVSEKDQQPRRFAAGNEGACEAIRTHLIKVMKAFNQMSEIPVNLEQADRYFLDVAHYFPKPGKKYSWIHLSDDQLSRFHSECKEQFSRLRDRVRTQAPTTLWDAYNIVIEWVDREGSALQGWERLSELWFSGVKDSALYVALKRMGLAGRSSRKGTRNGLDFG